jgi:hypothetical protein
MFEGELFGLDASQYRAFSAVIFTPAIGFVFLFLLGRPLKKLPIIDATADYTPPSWVLPVFALGALFSISLAMSIALSLSFLSSKPSLDRFLESFRKEFVIEFPPTLHRFDHATMTLEQYDGDSNFYIYVNNYRILSSEVNCMMKYQCKPYNEQLQTLFQSINSINFMDNSLHNIHKNYVLPYSEPILGWLVSGDNYVDVVSGNSGRGDCHLRLSFDFGDDHYSQINHVEIVPDIEPAHSSSKNIHNGYDYIFHSYGDTFDVSKHKQIEPYKTESSNPSYRLCDRVRLKMVVDPKILPTEVTDTSSWTAWASRRMQDSYCEIINHKGANCSGKSQ